MLKCRLCSSDLTSSNDSEAHIIPNALGGRLGARKAFAWRLRFSNCAAERGAVDEIVVDCGAFRLRSGGRASDFVS